MLASAVFKEESPLDYIFTNSKIVVSRNDLIACLPDALVIWGGEDISPTIYNQRPAPQTDAAFNLSLRDQTEMELAQAAIDKNIPIIGICRGAQLMCALSGGTVIQHVNRHAGPNHSIQTKDGQVLVTNSVHHQMMHPGTVDHELLGWVPSKLSNVYIGDNGEHITELETNDNFAEPEIVWFPKTKALCIQGHPEFSSAQAPFIRHCLKLVRRYILNQTETDED